MPLAISKGQNRLEQDSVVGETGLNRIQTHQWPLRIPVLLYKTELSSEGLRGLLMLRVRNIPVHGKNTSEYMKDPISEPREKRLDTWFYCWNTAKRNKSPTTRNTAGREGVREGRVGRVGRVGREGWEGWEGKGGKGNSWTLLFRTCKIIPKLFSNSPSFALTGKF